MMVARGTDGRYRVRHDVVARLGDVNSISGAAAFPLSARTSTGGGAIAARIAIHAPRPVPDYLRSNHISIDETGLSRIERSIRENYHTGWRARRPIALKTI